LLNRRSVKWDWLAPVAAASVFLLIVYSWRLSYRALSEETAALPLWYFVATLGSVIPFYLAGRAALPDYERVEKGIDLSDHYEFASRYLWSALFVSNVIYLCLVIHDVGFERLLAVLPYMWSTLLGFVLLAPLIIWQHRKLHRILVPVFFVFVCVVTLSAPMLG